MPVANPISDNYSISIRLDALDNLLNLYSVYFARSEAVKEIRAAHPVSFNDSDPE